VPSAVDPRDMERVRQPVEGERAGKRDHMAAVDEPAFEPALRRGILIEMNARVF
jgi:hypothetical protein